MRPRAAVLLGIMILGSISSAATAMVLEIAANGQIIIHDVAQTTTTIDRPRPTSLPFADAFARSSDRYELATDLLAAIGWAESRYRSRAKSSAGALGVMQLMPATARSLGVNPSVPAENILGGSAYVRTLLDRYDGDIVKTLAAYNAGPGAVDRYGGIPPFPETRAYVARILARLAAHSLDREQHP